MEHKPEGIAPEETLLHPEHFAPDGLPGRFLTNVASNYGAFAAGALVSMLLTPLLLHQLGQEAFAVWSLAVSVIGYLELLEFGFGIATTKLIAEDAGVRPDEAIRTLNTNFFMLVVMGLVALVLGAVVTVFAPSWFDVPDELRTEAALSFALLTIAMAVSIPGDSFGGALAGHQRYDLLSVSNTALVVLTGLASAVALFLGGGLVHLALATTIVSVSMHGVRWRMLRRAVPDIRLSPSLIDRGKIRMTAWLSGWFLVRDVASTINLRLDLVVATTLLGLKEAALYAVGGKLAKLAFGALSPIAQVMAPHASALHRREDGAQLEALLIDGTRTTLFIGLPVMILFTALAHPIVSAWVGPGYASAATVLIALAPVIGMESLITTLWEVLEGMGKAKLLALIACVEAAVNLSSSLVLGHAIGLVGVALGTVVAVAVVKFPAALILGSRSVGVSLRTLFRRSLAPNLLPAACMIAVVVGGRATLPENKLQGLLPIAVAGVLAYLLVYWRTGATPAEKERFRSIRRNRSAEVT